MSRRKDAIISCAHYLLVAGKELSAGIDICDVSAFGYASQATAWLYSESWAGNHIGLDSVVKAREACFRVACAGLGHSFGRPDGRGDAMQAIWNALTDLLALEPMTIRTSTITGQQLPFPRSA